MQQSIVDYFHLILDVLCDVVIAAAGFPTVEFSEGGPGGPPFGPPFTNFREGGARSLRNERGGHHIFQGGARGGQQFSQGGARGGHLIFVHLFIYYLFIYPLTFIIIIILYISFICYIIIIYYFIIYSLFQAS